MNIVYVTNKLVNGGGERVLLRLVEGVCQSGGKASILFVGKMGAIIPEIKKEIEGAGAKVITLQNPITFLRTIKSASTIHLYNVNVYIKALFVWPLLVNTRVICHVHGAAESANNIVRKIFSASWNPCDQILFVSEAGKKSYKIARGLVIPNPVVFPPQKTTKLIPGSKIRLLSVNRLVPIKRVTSQIEIIKLLHEKYDLDITLDIVGEGAEYNELIKKVESYKLSKVVRFLGSYEHNEVLNLYKNYDGFLATSSAEGLGLSLIEALSAGLITFASRIPPFQEIASISKGVQFIEPELPELSAELIANVFNSESIEFADTIALKKIFSPDTFVTRMMEIYQ